MTESSFTFLKVRGIPIGAHWSWLFVFALLAWSLGSEVFPHDYPELADSTYLVMGVATALAFFASILLHELGHAFRALKEGMRIDGITLWLFGGVARFSSMFPSAGAELRIAAAGPAVSVIIALTLWAVAAGGEALGLHESVTGIAAYLARINGILVAFNLVPALPLDGGRIFRAILWHRKGSFSAATISAAKAGRAFAIVLIGLGTLRFLGGLVTEGLWYSFLGWFLLQAAQAETSFVLVRHAFRNVRVGDLMTPNPASVPAGMTINDFFDAARSGRGHSTYPVEEGGRPVGMISVKLAGEVPIEERSTRTVGETMLRGDAVPMLHPNTPMLDALEALREGPGRAIVSAAGGLDGIISASDAARAIEIEQARGEDPLSRKRSRPSVLGAGAVVVLGAAMYFYHPPFTVISPGPAIDVAKDIEIKGIEVEAPRGKYLLTSVHVDEPNVFGMIGAFFDGEAHVLPRAAVIPPGTDQERFFRRQQEIFRESRMIAAAAAARSAGLEVSLEGTGARVIGVSPNTPAAGKLREGDVIVAVDGEAIRVVADLRTLVSPKPSGTVFSVTVERGRKKVDLRVASKELRNGSEAIIGFGIFVETRSMDVDLPFEIEFKTRDDIGGPSAGLVYALAVADMINKADLAAGRTIAATGTIDFEGEVGPIGGVEEKAVGARRAGAALFLVPKADGGGTERQGVPIKAVGTLQEAIDVLQTS